MFAVCNVSARRKNAAGCPQWAATLRVCCNSEQYTPPMLLVNLQRCQENAQSA